jgi:hypothetical protein
MDTIDKNPIVINSTVFTAADKLLKPVNNIRDIPPSFRDFLLHNQWNKTLLWTAGIFTLLQFIVFKYMYPYAGFFDGGSYAYLETAYRNLDVNVYPVGYSKFLRIFSAFTHSDVALVAFQYLLLQCSVLYLFFTLSFIYKPGKIIKTLLFICVTANPLFLYVSNYVTSDALFISLSVLWFTTLLWIIYRPTPRQTYIHALLLLLVFSVRYSALFYPLIAILAFLSSRQSLRKKVNGIALSILAIAGFMYHTSNHYKALTGIRQFSPFSGWQMANNALFAYRYAQNRDLEDMPARFRQLDAMVRIYFDTTRNVLANPQEKSTATSWYMWNAKSPLQIYLQKNYQRDSTTIGNLKPWATVAPLYADYSSYLIRKYPLEFARFYLWPNAIKYYVPPIEFLEEYNMGKDSVGAMIQMWFGYKSGKVKTIFKDLKVNVLDFYPVTVAIVNVLFVLGVLGFVLLWGIKQWPSMAVSLLLVSSLLVINMGFSIFAAPIALRFQIFPLLVALSFCLLLLEYVFKTAFLTKKPN